MASSYSWLARAADDNDDFDQALRYVELAINYWPDEPNMDWRGWAQRLREKIQERQEELAAAERQRQELGRQIASEAERQRADARVQVGAALAAAADKQRAAVADAESQRAEAARKITEQLKSAPFARVDRVAPVDVPVPQLSAGSWSGSFTNDKTAAALSLTQSGFDKLRETKLRAAEWLGEQAKEKSKEKAVETLFEHLPFSEAINHEIERQKNLVERYKVLFEEKKNSASEYVTGFFAVTHELVACEGAGGRGCEQAAAAKLETIGNKYANEEGERWKPWLREDIKAHGEIE
jgi:hypothetical protein